MSDEKTKGQQTQYGGKGQTGGTGGSSQAVQTIDFTSLDAIIKHLFSTGGMPITFSQTPPIPVDTTTRLNAKLPVSVAFPPCSDVMLSLIKTTGVPQNDKDDITLYFDEYFKFGQHNIVAEDPAKPDGKLADHLDGALLRCAQPTPIPLTAAASLTFGWPPPWCLPPSCVTLDGNRNPLPPPLPGQPTPPIPSIKRLFMADLIWLFYFERMGIFKILGVILDDFATKGRVPISNGSLDAPTIKDDIIALILEAMVRQAKMGLSSTVRDRDSSYRRCLGWTSDVGRKLGLDTMVNTGFSTLFHKFISDTTPFYADRRLAVAIRGTVVPSAPPSVATLITISDTISVLKQRLESFDYGRNYYNALSGIVWTIAGMSLIRELRTTLGIPVAYNSPHEYIPAAYDLLVMKRSVTHAEANRYTVHKECARDGRDILLDIQVLNDQDPNFAQPGGELERWLTQIEAKVEGYRTAYRTLTGVDLGMPQAPGTPVIEQQV